MRKFIVFTLVCLLYGTTAMAQEKPLEISIEKDIHGLGIITLNGNLTAGNVALFNSKANETLSSTVSRKILINMEKVKLIDEAGTAALIGFMRNVDRVRGHMRICCVSPEANLVFEVTGLDMVFEIFKNEYEARRTWRN